MATGIRAVGKAKVTPAADAGEVMHEQLEYLIEHAGNTLCGCAICGRYIIARRLLMELFDEPTAALENPAEAMRAEFDNLVDHFRLCGTVGCKTCEDFRQIATRLLEKGK